MRVRAVRTELRDLDDLAGNAARVVAAAHELPAEITVRVGLPYAPGWLAAAELIEADGLQASVRADSAPGFTDQLSGLVELDLPFSVSRSPYPVPTLLIAVDALVDGADPAEVAALLSERDHDRWRRAAQQWDQAAATRIRRRLRAVVVVDDLDAALRDLVLIS